MSSQASILVRKGRDGWGRNGMKDSPENNHNDENVDSGGDDDDDDGDDDDGDDDDDVIDENHSYLHEDLCTPLRFKFKGS